MPPAPPPARVRGLQRRLQRIAGVVPQATYGALNRDSTATSSHRRPPVVDVGNPAGGVVTGKLTETPHDLWTQWAADIMGRYAGDVYKLAPEDIAIAVHCMGAMRHSAGVAAALAGPALHACVPLGARCGLLLPGYARLRVVPETLFRRVAAVLVLPSVLPRVAASTAAGVFWSCATTRCAMRELGVLSALAMNTVRQQLHDATCLPHVVAILKASAATGGFYTAVADRVFTTLADRLSSMTATTGHSGSANADDGGDTIALLRALSVHPSQGGALDRCLAAVVARRPLLAAAALSEREQYLLVLKVAPHLHAATVRALAPCLASKPLLALLRATAHPEATFPAVRGVRFDADWELLVAFAKALHRRGTVDAGVWRHIMHAAQRLSRYGLEHSMLARVAPGGAGALLEVVPWRVATPGYLGVLYNRCPPLRLLRVMRGTGVYCIANLERALDHLARADVFPSLSLKDAALAVGMSGFVVREAPPAAAAATTALPPSHQIIHQFLKRLWVGRAVGGFAGGHVFSTLQLFRVCAAIVDADVALPEALRVVLASRLEILAQQHEQQPVDDAVVSGFCELARAVAAAVGVVARGASTPPNHLSTAAAVASASTPPDRPSTTRIPRRGDSGGAGASAPALRGGGSAAGSSAGAPQSVRAASADCESPKGTPTARDAPFHQFGCDIEDIPFATRAERLLLPQAPDDTRSASAVATPVRGAVLQKVAYATDPAAARPLYPDLLPAIIATLEGFCLRSPLFDNRRRGEDGGHGVASTSGVGDAQAATHPRPEPTPAGINPPSQGVHLLRLIDVLAREGAGGRGDADGDDVYGDDARGDTLGSGGGGGTCDLWKTYQILARQVRRAPAGSFKHTPVQLLRGAYHALRALEARYARRERPEVVSAVWSREVWVAKAPLSPRQAGVLKAGVRRSTATTTTPTVAAGAAATALPAAITISSHPAWYAVDGGAAGARGALAYVNAHVLDPAASKVLEDALYDRWEELVGVQPECFDDVLLQSVLSQRRRREVERTEGDGVRDPSATTPIPPRPPVDATDEAYPPHLVGADGAANWGGMGTHSNTGRVHDATDPEGGVLVDQRGPSRSGHARSDGARRGRTGVCEGGGEAIPAPPACPSPAAVAYDALSLAARGGDCELHALVLACVAAAGGGERGGTIAPPLPPSVVDTAVMRHPRVLDALLHTLCSAA